MSLYTREVREEKLTEFLREDEPTPRAEDGEQSLFAMTSRRKKARKRTAFTGAGQ